MKLFHRRGAEAQRLIEEFVRVFPQRCLICSYWRFGRNNFLTKKETPAHECIEASPRLRASAVKGNS